MEAFLRDPAACERRIPAWLVPEALCWLARCCGASRSHPAAAAPRRSTPTLSRCAPICSDVLCCAVLCCAVLCCAVFCARACVLCARCARPLLGRTGPAHRAKRLREAAPRRSASVTCASQQPTRAAGAAQVNTPLLHLLRDLYICLAPLTPLVDKTFHEARALPARLPPAHLPRAPAHPDRPSPAVANEALPCIAARCCALMPCPISSEGWTRRVQFVREGGRASPRAAARCEAGPSDPPPPRARRRVGWTRRRSRRCAGASSASRRARSASAPCSRRPTRSTSPSTLLRAFLLC